MILLVKDATTIGISEAITTTTDKDTGHSDHSFQVVLNGSPTAVTLELEGSIDGDNFDVLFEHNLTDKDISIGTSLFHLTNKPIPKIRVKITKLDGGVSPEVTVYYFKGSVSK